MSRGWPLGVLVGALGALAWGMTAAAQPAAGVPGADAGRFGSMFRFTEQGGAAIYQSVCAGCHMADGQGATGAGTYPALAGDAKLANADYAVATVLHGERAMPPFARFLTDQQVADVVGYIRTHFGNDYPDAPSADAVKAAR